MKNLLILAFLFCSAPAWAVIARGSGACTGTTSCTPSAATTFGLEISAAGRSSTSLVTLPAAWKSVLTKTGTTSSLRLSCRVNISTTAVISGTFTSAANLGIQSYTGTGSRATQDCGFNGVAVGASAGGSGTGSSITCPALTLTNGGGTSWVGCAVFSSGGSADLCTPAGMSAIAGASTGDIGMYDTNGAVSSFSAASCTGIAANWVAISYEIIVPPTAPTPVSQFVFGDGGDQVNYPGNSNSGNNYVVRFDPQRAGNLMVIRTMHSYSSGWTLTITTDQSQTATKAVSCDNAGNGDSSAIYYIPNLTANTSQLTFTYGTAVAMFSPAVYVYSGMATSTPLEGTPSCTTGNTSSGAVVGNLADGTGTTPSTNGDLIFSTFQDENLVNGAATTIYDMIPTAAWSGLAAGPLWGSLDEDFIQSTAALIKPAVTIPQSSNDSWSIATAAFKTSPGAGTARVNERFCVRIRAILMTQAHRKFNRFIATLETSSI